MNESYYGWKRAHYHVSLSKRRGILREKEFQSETLF